MTNKILCAVEPNEEARRIMALTASLVKTHGGDVSVLHVVKPLLHIYGDLNFTPLVEAEAGIEHAAREEAQAFLRNCAEEVGIDPANIEVHSGYPATEISRVAKDEGIDLIVIGVHNRRGLSRLLGSTARAVLTETACPLLAVHPDHDTANYDNVVVAVDTSKMMPEVLAHACSFVPHASKTNVVTVVVPVGAAMAGMSPESFSSRWPLHEIQADIVEQVRGSISTAMQKAGLQGSDLAVLEGDPASEIIDFAKTQGSDLIIVGAGKRSLLDRLLIGSTTHALLNHPPCDVFVAR